MLRARYFSSLRARRCRSLSFLQQTLDRSGLVGSHCSKPSALSGDLERRRSYHGSHGLYGSDSDARNYATPSSMQPRVDQMLPENCFKGKTALVTGGGTGLGLAMATRFSLLGAKVAIMSRKIDTLQQSSEKIQELTQNEVFPVAADVRDDEAVKKAVDSIEEAIGLPSIVVNNAAGNFVAPFERLNAKGFATIVDIVLKGTANVTLDVGKRMIKQGTGGVFLCISTAYATTGSGFTVPSGAAKAGVENMVKSLSTEWGKYGIRFVGIAPGPIRTKGAFSRLDPTGEFEEILRTNNPTKRFGEPGELSNLASYLVSDYASWLNGEIVRLDGGESAQIGGEFNALLKLSPDKWDEMERIIRGTNKKGS